MPTFHIVLLGDMGEGDLVSRLAGRFGVHVDVAHASSPEQLAAFLADAGRVSVLLIASRKLVDLAAAIRVWRAAAPGSPLVVVTTPGSEGLAAMGAREGALVVPRDLLALALELAPQQGTIPAAKAEELEIRGEMAESLEQLTSRIAHEGKNALTLVLMGIEYVGRHLTVRGPEVGGALEDMEEAAGKINAVIRALAELARAPYLETRPESINLILEEALTRMKSQFEGMEIRVVRELHPSLPFVQIDRARTSSVLDLVLQSALRRLQEGGDLFVRSSISEGHADEPTNRTVVLVDIVDTGALPSAADIERIFDPLDPAGVEGASRGPRLPLAREIIGLQGGAIVARQGEETKGLRISISFRTADGWDRSRAS